MRSLYSEVHKKPYFMES